MNYPDLFKHLVRIAQVAANDAGEIERNMISQWGIEHQYAREAAELRGQANAALDAARKTLAAWEVYAAKEVNQQPASA